MKYAIVVLALALSACMPNNYELIRIANSQPCDEQGLYRVWDGWLKGYQWIHKLDCSSQQECLKKYKRDHWNAYQVMLANAEPMREAGFCGATYDEYGRWIRPDGSTDPLVTGSQAWRCREGYLTGKVCDNPTNWVY